MHRRSPRSAPASAPAAAPAGEARTRITARRRPLRAGDVLQHRLIAARPAMQPPATAPRPRDAVQLVEAGNRRSPPAAGTGSSTRRTSRAAARSDHLRPVPLRSQARNPPKSASVSASHARPNTPGTSTTTPAPGHRTSPCSARPLQPAGTPGTPPPARPRHGPTAEHRPRAAPPGSTTRCVRHPQRTRHPSSWPVT